MASKRAIAGQVFTSFFLLIARVALGVLLLSHAWWRWSIAGMNAQIDLLTAVGFPYPSIMAWQTLVFEALGGALMIIGLLTRFVALLVVVEQVLIIAWTKWFNGFFNAAGGFEYNVALCALGVVFFAVGASYTGLDSLLFRKKPAPEPAPATPPAAPYRPVTVPVTSTTSRPPVVGTPSPVTGPTNAATNSFSNQSGLGR